MNKLIDDLLGQIVDIILDIINNTIVDRINPLKYLIKRIDVGDLPHNHMTVESEILI